jgi:hypothetical protein
MVKLPEGGRVSVWEKRPAPRNARRARKSITGRRTPILMAEEIDEQSRYRKHRRMRVRRRRQRDRDL